MKQMESRRIQAGPHAIELSLFGPSPSAPAGHWAVTCWSCQEGRVMSDDGSTALDWADEHGAGAVNLRAALTDLQALAGIADDDRRCADGRLF